MTEARADEAPVLYPIQLSEVHCATVRAEHKEKPTEPRPDETAVRLGLTELDDARRAFRARLEVELTATALDDDEIAELLVVVQGTFTSESDISDELYSRYTEFTPVALLWPYARAYLAQLAAMLGLTIPPLPSLDVVGLSRANEEQAQEV